MNRTLRRLAAALSLIVLAVAALLVSLPPMIAGLATYWLRSQGFEATVQDIDLHLLRGRLAVWGLHLRGPEGLRMDLGSAEFRIHPRALLRAHRVHLTQGTVRDLDLTLTTDAQGRPRLPFLGGGARDSASNADSGAHWSVGIDRLELARIRVRLDHPKEDLRLRIDRLDLADLHDWLPRQQSHLHLDANLNGAPVHAALELRPFADTPTLAGTVSIERLALAPLKPWLPGSPGQLQGSLDLRVRLEARQQTGGIPDLKVQGQVSGKALEVVVGGRGFRAATLDAPLGLRLEGSGHGGRLVARGRLHGTRLALSDPGRPISGVALGALDAKGLKLEFPLQRSETPAWVLETDLALSDLRLGAREPATPLATLDHARAEGVSLRPAQNRFILSRLTAAGLSLPGPGSDADPLLGLDTLHAGPMRWDGKLADLGQIVLEGLQARLLIQPDGRLTLPLLAAHLQPSPARDPDADTKGREAARGTAGAQNASTNTNDEGEIRLPVRIASLEMKGENRVNLTDRSLHPTYRGHYRIRQLRIAPIDGARPDTPSHIDIEAKLHQYTRLSLHGQAQLLAWPPREAELELVLRSVSLPRLNPWLLKYTGYAAETGQLHLKASPKIHQSILDATLHLNLNGYRLTRADPERAAAFDERIGIGLVEALSMVRDSKGNVSLTLPIKGDLRNPHFDPAPVIAEALKHAITQAATAYAVYAIQPYGAALLLTRIAGKTVLKLHFDPLFFEPGKADAQALPTDYLDKLAGLLRERPGIRLRICGIASERDREALPKAQRTDDDLLVLARQRSITVKEAMISRGIDGERLLVCKPRVETGENARPRVELES